LLFTQKIVFCAGERLACCLLSGLHGGGGHVHEFRSCGSSGGGLMGANFKRQLDELPMLIAWKTMRFIYYNIIMHKMHRLILGLVLIFTVLSCCAVGSLWSRKAVFALRFSE
jgi:hypothetical protein